MLFTLFTAMKIIGNNVVSGNNLKVIIGLGKTGLSCARYLHRQNANIAITDSREHPPGLDEFLNSFPHVPISVGGFDSALCEDAAELIVSPGVSLREPVIAKQINKGTPVIGDIELFARAATAPVIAITGSNGKSTVTSLVGEMARCAKWRVRVGGNLGVPALDLLNGGEPDLYVLELSSFQLETTYSLKPVSAAVLNISQDHLDRYDHLDEYIHAKLRVYQNCRICVYNREDSATFMQQTQPVIKAISFGLNTPGQDQFGLIEEKDQWYLAHGNQKLLPTDALKIKGHHNIANALAALALGDAAKIPMPAMLDALQTFPGLPHRCQWVAKINGVEWYNDSKATNIGAARAAIVGLGHEIKGKIVLIAGGQGKNADFSELSPCVKQFVRAIILIGQDAKQIEEKLVEFAPCLHVRTLQDAVSAAQKIALAGDCVLLAPACASYDMFNHFEHRGEVFMAAVRALQ